ncbi:hypothetical protein [Planomonospora parontospora]|uniref:hypothetical protein n=1 Tax=Planomonospora parontospora TaxID=58119 RepID=UPI001951DC54|nr:hypothetical protein [Planomonospora parontospora]
MRRWAVPLVAVVLSTALPQPGTAQAAPSQPGTAQGAPSPVTALRRHFVEHTGLRISDVGRVHRDGRAVVTIWRRGRVEFDASGVYATDTTGRTEAGRGAIREFEGLIGRRLGSTRVICFPNEAYLSGPGYETWLPEGKSWLGLIGPANIKQTAALPQIVNVFEPATLGVLLSHSSVKRRLPSGAYHQGTVTLRTLYRVSPSFRDRLAGPPKGRSAKITVGFRLWLDRSNLARRLTTTWRQPVPGTPKRPTVTVADTRYTGWGSDVTLAPPPPEDTADAGRVGGDLSPPPTLPVG